MEEVISRVDARQDAHHDTRLDARRIALIETSFRRLVAVADLTFELFQGRLYLLDPELAEAITGRTVKPQKRMVRFIGAIVDVLDRPCELKTLLMMMGRRWAAYGVGGRQYDIIGTTLLWTLEQILGEGFNPALKDAWCEVYRHIAGIAYEAARPLLEPIRDAASGDRITVPEPPVAARRAAAPRSMRGGRTKTTISEGFPAVRVTMGPSSSRRNGYRFVLPGSVPAQSSDTAPPSAPPSQQGDRVAIFEGLSPFHPSAAMTPNQPSRRITLPQGISIEAVGAPPASSSW